MSDDESTRPAAEPTPAPEPGPATAGTTDGAPADTERAPATDTSTSEPAADGTAVADTAVLPVDDTAVLPAPAPGPAAASDQAAPAPVATTEAAPAPTAPAPPKAPSKALAFLRANVAVLVLAVLLVGAIVWGVLGTLSSNDWESRATSLSSDLASTEQSLADAEAAIDDLETAKSRAETTASACVGAIDDADAMLEVSAKLDDKTLAYVSGLNDFIAAVNVGDVAAVETIGAEMDKLTVQIEDLTTKIDGHVDDYGDAAEGCHVDAAQDV